MKIHKLDDTISHHVSVSGPSVMFPFLLAKLPDRLRPPEELANDRLSPRRVVCWLELGPIDLGIQPPIPPEQTLENWESLPKRQVEFSTGMLSSKRIFPLAVCKREPGWDVMLAEVGDTFLWTMVPPTE